MSDPTPGHLAKLAKLRPDVADRIRERAAIIAEACGIPWQDADAIAYAQEIPGQRGLPGVT